MNYLWKKEIKNNRKYLDQAIELWQDNFHDGKQFAQHFIELYESNYDYIFAIENDQVASMGYVIQKDLLIENKVEKTFLIAGVATRKDFLRKGLMSNILNSILEKYSNEKVFIQSEHWEYYKNWNFHNISDIYEYDVKEINDNHLDKIDFNENTNWNDLLETFNLQGSLKYNLKQFKEYIEMFKLSEGKFLSYRKSYVIYENDTIFEFGFDNIDDFLKIVKSLNIKKIKSHIKLDSSVLVKTDQVVFTKATKEWKKIIYNTYF